MNKDYMESYIVVTDGDTTYAIIKHHGDEHPLISHWAHCIGCEKKLCIFDEHTDSGQSRSEETMESYDAFDWWFVDGTWLCSSCT